MRAVKTSGSVVRRLALIALLPVALVACQGRAVHDERYLTAEPVSGWPTLSRSDAACATGWSTGFDTRLSRPEGHPSRLRVLVSRLPRARARVARRDTGAASRGAVPDGRHHSGAAPRPRPAVHAVEGDGLADSGRLAQFAHTTVVPQTLAIDEHGIVRLINPDKDRIEDEFLSQRYGATLAAEAMPPDEATLPRPAARASAGAWRAYGDQLFRWGSPEGLTDVITSYEHALALEPDHGPTYFRLGVAHRARYDSDDRQPDDFRQAVEHWEAALDVDPNNYIWRRRIQQYGQYGPRLDKPYPFYDWVPTARAAIEARGAAPVPLEVEPGGAEFAEPAETFVTADETVSEPDPDNRIYQDPAELILVEALTVPTRIIAGSSTRAHLTFRPNLERKAHWNNEAEDMVFWVNPPDGWEVDVRHVTVERPPQVVSLETTPGWSSRSAALGKRTRGRRGGAGLCALLRCARMSTAPACIEDRMFAIELQVIGAR